MNVSWIPVATQPPRDVTVIFFHCLSRQPYIGYFDEERNLWDSGTLVHSPEFVTHWMPLPEPPTTP